jgi:hypothetical protein
VTDEEERRWDPRLWGRPRSGGVLEHLMVIGPYPSADFFDELKQRFNPKRVLLVVDEGWGDTDIAKIRERFPAGKLWVRYAYVRGGLVHAKLYLASWKLTGGQTRRSLIWGSANASAQGFKGHAETLSSIPLPRELRRYFEDLRAPSGRVKGMLVPLDGNLSLVLPTFDFKQDREPETFEGWLQGGRLFHKFDKDQTFGHLHVKLRKPLPLGAEARLFAKKRLRAKAQRTVVRFDYAGLGALKEKGTSQWKTPYFVETWLGHWTSADCFNEKIEPLLSEFRFPHRTQVIKRIGAAEKDERDGWFADLIRILNGVASDLAKNGVEARNFLAMAGDEVSANAYQRLAERQLDRHHAQANNERFRLRLETGFVFPRVPAFRGASVEQWSFDDFVKDFCENISRGAAKGRAKNKLVQRVRLVLDEHKHDHSLAEMDGDDVRQFLIEHWHDRSAETGRTVGERVKAFYEEK